MSNEASELSFPATAAEKEKSIIDRQWSLFFLATSSLFFLGALYFFVAGPFLLFAAAVALSGLCVLLLINAKTLTILALIGMPSAFVYANNGLSVLPFVTLDRAIIFLMIGFFFVETIYHRRDITPMMFLERLSLVFLAIISVSLLFGLPSRAQAQWGPDIAMAVQGYFLPLVGFILIRRMRWRPRHLRQIYVALALIGAISGVAAIVQVYFGFNIFEPTWIELNPEHAERATGPFANATEFGAVCVIGLTFSIWLMRETKGPEALFAIVSISLALIGVVLCQTRAVWGAAILVVLVLALMDRRIFRTLIVPAMVCGALFILAAPFVFSNPAFQERLSETSPIYNRLTSLTTAGNIISDHPVTGVGFGKKTFELAKPGRYADFGGVSASYAVDLGPPHNEWVHVFAMLGIPAGLMFVTIWGLMTLRLWSLAKWEKMSSADAEVVAPVFAITLATILYSLLVDIGYFYYIPFATWALAAIVFAVVGFEKDTR